MNIQAVKDYLALPVDKRNKTKAAAACGVSPRSFGRWIDKYNSTPQPATDTKVAAVPVVDDADKKKQLTKKVNSGKVAVAKPVAEPETTQSVLTWFVTKGTITMTLTDGTSVSIMSDNAKYQEILTALIADDFKTAVSLSNTKRAFSFMFGNVEYKDGNVLYKGKKISSDIAAVITERAVAGQDGDVQRYVKFLNNLMENPSYSSTQQLFPFLQKFDITIDEDGMIEAWKVVRSNYYDKHTGTFDNSVGKIVKMSRNEVEDNPSKLCSKGLHLCSKSYINTFYSRGDRVLKCLLNPRDAVSVPSDYQGAKLRCCEYLVKADVTKQYESGKFN